MRGFLLRVFQVILMIIACAYLNSCSSIPLKENGLEIGKDTVAGIDDIGVGRVTKQF